MAEIILLQPAPVRNYIKRIPDIKLSTGLIRSLALKKSLIKRLTGLALPTNLNKLVEFGFLFFTFFPYLYLVPIIRSDIQPYAFLLSGILVIIWLPFQIPKALTWFLMVLITASTILFFDVINLDSIRNYLGYLSLTFQTYATYKYIRKYGIPYQPIFIFTLIWFTVGLVQQVYPDFLGFLLRRTTSGGGGRGVSSLAAEPTFYGIVAVFLALIAYVSDHPKKQLLLWLNLIQIVLLSRSSMMMVYLALFLGLYILFNSSWRRLLSFTFIGIIGLFVLVQVASSLRTIRIFGILNRLSSEGFLLLIKRDESVNDRAAHIYFSIKAFLEDWFLPHGYVSFKNYLEVEVPLSDVFWWVSESNKVLSAYGALVYELGLIGLMLPLGITHIIWKGLDQGRRMKITIIVFVHALLFSGIPISLPLLSFFIGLSLAKPFLNEGIARS